MGVRKHFAIRHMKHFFFYKMRKTSKIFMLEIGGLGIILDCGWVEKKLRSTFLTQSKSL